MQDSGLEIYHIIGNVTLNEKGSELNAVQRLVSATTEPLIGIGTENNISVARIVSRPRRNASCHVQGPCN